MSADGNTLAAVAPLDSNFFSSGAVFFSTNSALSWVSNNLANLTGGSPYLAGVAMSADGRKIFVTGPIEPCYSTNFGASWMQMTSAPPTYSFVSPSQCIAASADGNRLIMSVAPSEGQNLVYTSTNSGATWNLSPLAPNDWSFVASSADGKTLMATTTGLSVPGILDISTNFGASWTSNTNENWTGVACSADGGSLFAAAGSDDNFVINSGAIYRSQTIQPPLLNIAPTGDKTLLSWLIPSTDFSLEQSPDLNLWTAVTNSPALNPANLQEQILVSPTNRAGFYRLVTVPAN